MRRWATIPIVLLTLAFLWPGAAHGQGSTTANLSGQVVDEEGDPLPGANVIAIHQPTGTRYGVSANQNGRYRLNNMRVGGPYQVTASFVGYQSKRETGVQLTLGETQRIDFQLSQKTAEMEEVSIVAERNAVMSGDRKGMVTNISAEEIESQPTMGRKVADIARLTPQAYVQNSNDDGASISIAGQYNRFNAIYIDGAVSNDVFGLSAQGTDGGQSGATPISLSAVEQVSVDVSPFDVTKSGFTGGAINFVTKSGTNEYTGSFEYYRRSSNLTQNELTVDGNQVVDGLPSAPDNRYVFSVGGPIVKDKLFFFVNADIRRSEDALPFQGYDGATSFRGDDNNRLDGIDEVRDFMIRNTGYDPGTPGDKSAILDSEKFLGRLDYNLNQNHRLTARYYYNDNFNIDRFQSTRTGINFSNNSEVFPNTQHNAMLQWNGSFGSMVSTKTTATFKNVVDDRAVEGEPFPAITVSETGGEYSLGSEPFSRPNYLEQTVATLSNQTDIFVGDHTITVGSHNEFYSIDNRFALFGPGLYEFGSTADFAETVCHYAEQNQGSYGIDGPGPICQAQYPDPEPQTATYLRQYSLLDDNPDTAEFESFANDDTQLRSDFNAVNLGLYAQDEWQVLDRLRLTFGLRADIPKILDDPQAHPTANDETIPAIQDAGYELAGAQAGQMPSWRAFWSPRFGFNYAFDEERSSQLRGGVGVFTSRLPYVWPGGAFLNDGVSSDFLVGGKFPFLTSIGVVDGQTPPLRRPGNAITRPEQNDYRIFGDTDVPVSEIRPTGDLYLFTEDFSYPRVMRLSLAYDQELPLGFIGTLEGQYSSQLEDIIVQNVNLKQPNATLDGPDNRPIYRAGQYEDESANIDGRYGDIFLMKNTDRGYSYNVTAQLRKETFRVVENGFLRSSLSYTYGESRSLNGFDDTLGSNWDGNAHVNGTNSLTLGRSPYSLGHRIQFSAAYRHEFSENIAANLSLYYSGTSGRPFSYTIGSAGDLDVTEDMIGDGGGAPLFYVPQDVDNLQFSPITNGQGEVLRTVAEQKQDLARFIDNVDYLSENRGDYVTRNGDRTPFEGVVDLQFSVDVMGDVVGRNQRLTLSANVFNFSSLLGDVFGTDWGRRYQRLPGDSYNVVNFAGFEDPENGNYTPVYQSNLGTRDADVVQSKEDIVNVETTGTTYSSLYQVQLGVKYTF